MKKAFLVVTFVFAYVFTAFAGEDIFYYQGKFSDAVDQFKAGVKDSVEFDKVVGQLDLLQAWLAREDSIKKKEPLLGDIRAVKAFLGELSPSKESFSLTLDQKKIAMGLLEVNQTLYDDTTFCLPIYEVILWDSAYTAYMVENTLDTVLYTYKIDFNLQKNYSSVTGFVEAGVSRKSSRGVFGSFGHITSMAFTQVKCDTTIQAVRYIQPEVIQPKIEEYPEPDYLSPQQKKALKVKQKKELKKLKAKRKKEAKKEKERQKKEKMKERIEAKKAMQMQQEERKKAAAEKGESKKEK